MVRQKNDFLMKTTCNEGELVFARELRFVRILKCKTCKK